MPDQIKPVYSGECMLLRWGDNHRGRSVTLELDADSAEHPFKGLKCGESGQRMQLVAVLIDDNEQPMDPPVSVKPTAPPQVGEIARATLDIEDQIRRAKIDPLGTRPKKEFTRSQIAALKIRDTDFVDWLCARYPEHWDTAADLAETVSAAEMADFTLKEALGITSKRELDTNPEKAEAFDKILASYDYRDRVK